SGPKQRTQIPLANAGYALSQTRQRSPSTIVFPRARACGCDLEPEDLGAVTKARTKLGGRSFRVPFVGPDDDRRARAGQGDAGRAFGRMLLQLREQRGAVDPVGLVQLVAPYGVAEERGIGGCDRRPEH